MGNLGAAEAEGEDKAGTPIQSTPGCTTSTPEGPSLSSVINLKISPWNEGGINDGETTPYLQS